MLSADIKTYAGALDYFDKSLKNLDTEYIDLYLVHAPWPWNSMGVDFALENCEVWKAVIELYNAKRVKAIAEKYHTSLAKICLRYCLQRKTLPLPKSVHRQRIKENIEIDFELQEEDMNYLDSLYHIASTRLFRS